MDEQDLIDAKRYRWIRDSKPNHQTLACGGIDIGRYIGMFWSAKHYQGSEMDKAVDDAMKEQIINDHNHYNGENCWFVKWSNGQSQKYTPYDSIGMTTFIKRGLEQGTVTINGFEVVTDTSNSVFGDYWKFKE